MSITACAALVEKADPERFRAAMTAPVQARPVLFALYAFNVEVSRAPWVTEEPMIAEMRLQWWRDALSEIAAGGAVRRHEIVDGLATVLDAEGAECLDQLVAARRWDIYKDSFEDDAHLNEYLAATSGHLMWTAARLLGPADETTVRNFAFGVGVANLLRACADLEARGRRPLLDGTPVGVKALAHAGMLQLEEARRARSTVSKAAGSALVAGFAARRLLQQAMTRPADVAAGQIALTPFAQSKRLLAASLRGWWV